jgi:hypothetical protein
MPDEITTRQILIDTLRSVALWLAIFLPASIGLTLLLHAVGVSSPVLPAVVGGLCGAGTVWLRARLRRP